MQITEQEQKAANEIIELIAKELGNNRAIHPVSAISSCARLSGSFMFRSFNFPAENITPGAVVLSEQANERGPELVNIVGWVLSTFGITIDREKLKTTPESKATASCLDTLKSLQDKVAKIMGEYTLNFQQMAYACAMATAFIIKECKNDLPVESGFNTAVYGFIEGSKTFPPEFSNPPEK